MLFLFYITHFLKTFFHEIHDKNIGFFLKKNNLNDISFLMVNNFFLFNYFWLKRGKNAKRKNS